MTLNQISLHRLSSQQLTYTKFEMPQPLVQRMGAIQAQDSSMALWALGIRLREPGLSLIQNAIDSGEIIRTHVLRPTWHLVSAEDVSWMLRLSAPYIRASLKSRHRELELTPAVVGKAFRIIEKALTHAGHLTREQLMGELEAGKISTMAQRAPHLLLLAELDQLICSGPGKGKSNTYALFAQRIPRTRELTEEEALATLAARYFESRGPATLQDFKWWSGLPAAAARKGLEMVEKKFHTEKLGTQTYWMSPSALRPRAPGRTLCLLPAFDEFIIGYKDRTACLALADQRNAISSNGIFRPVVVYNGEAIGLWKKKRSGTAFSVETQLFPALKARPKQRLKELEKLIRKASEKVTAFYSGESSSALPTNA